MPAEVYRRWPEALYAAVGASRNAGSKISGVAQPITPPRLAGPKGSLVLFRRGGKMWFTTHLMSAAISSSFQARLLLIVHDRRRQAECDSVNFGHGDTLALTRGSFTFRMWKPTPERIGPTMSRLSSRCSAHGRKSPAAHGYGPSPSDHL